MANNTMREPSDLTLERTKVREVAGIFHSREALDAAVRDLLVAGFDRADVDIVAPPDEVRKRIGPVYVVPEELADLRGVPRRPFIAPEDLTLTAGIIIGVVAAGGAMAAAFSLLVAGVESTVAGAAAAVVGAIAGGAVASMVLGLFRKLKVHDKSIEAQMAKRGIVVWVRVRTPTSEEKAQQILREHGARAVRVHEIAIDKRLEDIPLSSLRPDPWLGEERLGRL
jgi:hypothetical protein